MFCTHACVIYLKSTINMDRDISIKHATGSCITTFSPKFRVLGTQIQKNPCFSRSAEFAFVGSTCMASHLGRGILSGPMLFLLRCSLKHRLSPVDNV